MLFLQLLMRNLSKYHFIALCAAACICMPVWCYGAFYPPDQAQAQSSGPVKSRTDSIRMADVLLMSAVEKYHEDDDVNAERLLKDAAQLDTLNDAVQYYLGYMAVLKNDVAAAAKHFETAYSLDSTNVWYETRLGSAYLAMNRMTDAEKIFADLYSKRPYDTGTISQLLDICLQNGKLAEADSLRLRMETVDGPSEYTMLTRLEILRKQAKYGEFFDGLNEYFADNYVDPEQKTKLIDKLLETGDPRFNYAHLADYERLVNTCLNTHPDDSSTVHYAGGFFYSLGRDEELLSLCARHTGDPDMVQMAIASYQRRGKYEECIRECDHLLQMCGPENVQEQTMVYTSKADCYHNLGRKGKASREYSKAYKLNPSDPGVLNNYAYFLCVEGRNMKKALEMSAKALEAKPESVEFIDTYGWILYRLKRYAEAKPVFKKAMLYGGKDSPVILRHYADVLDALGEKTLAEGYRSQARIKDEKKN